MQSSIKNVLESNATFSHLDIRFARLMQQLAQSDDDGLLLLAALVSSQTRAGHICFDLSDLQDEGFLNTHFEEQKVPKLLLPSTEKASEFLETCPVVGHPGDFQPLILERGHRLYLYRYWQYQEQVITAIKERAPLMEKVDDPGEFNQNLNQYFSEKTEEIDWQKVAATTALLKPFCVITGGPGTGKTFTVAKILALAVQQAGDKELSIRLAAPTGKAAVRLQESIMKVKKTLTCSDDIKEMIPEEASTLHRLLGYRPHSPYFRHNAENPLPVDLLVVDEASMVDLALMAKLMQALPKHARLILLGDHNQLASVEAGAVLGDICDTGTSHGFSDDFSEQVRSLSGLELASETENDINVGIHDCIVQLHKSYRFEARKGIAALSAAINAGNGDGALELLRGQTFSDIRWQSLGSANFFDSLLEELSDYGASEDPAELLQQFGRFRVLCAVRQGPQGVHTMNAKIEQYLKRKRNIVLGKTWYTGQPLLVTENDHKLQLYNGDVGIVAPDPEDGDIMKVHFPAPEGAFRKFRPFRLPTHEVAYAMTVHKSQGSEFEKIFLLLPEKDSPLLTRELIYTAITRAGKEVEIWGNKDVFCEAVARRIKRTSGLRDALWGFSEMV